MSKKKSFTAHISVKLDQDDYLLVVGSPDHVAMIDADDGERIVTYTRNGPVKVYRTYPRLDAQ